MKDKDKYINYRHLAAEESDGLDYVIRCEDRGSSLVVIGPHAGRIEPGTTELVEAIAGDDLSFYLFEGTKPERNGGLHITSTNFDEPKAISSLSKCKKALALHGERCAEELVYLGGRDEVLRPHIARSLVEAGFTTAKHDDPALQGTSPENICNRCISGAGLQLELSRGLRQRFFQSLSSSGRRDRTDTFYKFVRAIREGIESASEF